MKWQIVRLNKKTIQVKKDEEVGVLVLAKKTGDYDLRVDLIEKGAKALILGLVIGQDGNIVNLKIQTRHWAGNTHAQTVIYGVNKDVSETQVKGLIIIDKKADQVTDFLTTKILLLSDQAKAMIEPSLEIKADEVRASHAATVAPLDKEQLFYLMSRGLLRSEAKRIMVIGFIKTVLERIDNDKIRRQIAKEFKNVEY